MCQVCVLQGSETAVGQQPCVSLQNKVNVFADKSAARAPNTWGDEPEDASPTKIPAGKVILS